MHRALPLLAAIAVVAGCAGGSDSGPTREQFARKADLACSKERRKVEAIRRPGALILFAGYLEKTLPLVRAQRQALADVQPPKDERNEVAKLLDGYDAVIAALERMRQGGRSGDTPAVVFGLRQAAAANKTVEQRAGALGIVACGALNPFQQK